MSRIFALVLALCGTGGLAHVCLSALPGEEVMMEARIALRDAPRYDTPPRPTPIIALGPVDDSAETSARERLARLGAALPDSIR